LHQSKEKAQDPRDMPIYQLKDVQEGMEQTKQWSCVQQNFKKEMQSRYIISARVVAGDKINWTLRLGFLCILTSPPLLRSTGSANT